MVTGCFAGRDKSKRKDVHIFFLAPQDKYSFILKDVFRYVKENVIDTISANSVAQEYAPNKERATKLVDSVFVGF